MLEVLSVGAEEEEKKKIKLYETDSSVIKSRPKFDLLSKGNGKVASSQRTMNQLFKKI